MFASYPGSIAIASTPPVCGSSTIAVASFAPHLATVERSTCSAFAWIVWSSVRNTFFPSRAGFSFSIEMTCPSGSRTTVSSPGLPVSCVFSSSSSPASPLLSTPA